MFSAFMEVGILLARTQKYKFGNMFLKLRDIVANFGDFSDFSSDFSKIYIYLLSLIY